MNWIKIAAFKIRQIWTKPSSVTILILFPVLLMLILGAAFAGQFSSVSENINISIAYLPGNSALHNGFELLLPLLPEGMITMERVADENEGINLIKDGSVDCFLQMNAEENEIVISEDELSGFEAGILESILESYLDYFVLSHIASETAISIDYPSQGDINAIRLQSLSKKEKPSSIDYYGITMLTMFLLYGGFAAAFSIMLERRNRTFQRIYAGPTSIIQFWSGINLGALFSIFIQCIAVFVIGSTLLNINYGHSYLKLFIILFSECLFSLALGSGISIMIKEEKAVDTIINIVIPTIVFLGGGFIQLPSEGFLVVARNISPVYWINQAMFETIYGDGNNFFIISVSVCCLLAVAGFSVSTYRFIRGEKI